jgi:hypothetical protein
MGEHNKRANSVGGNAEHSRARPQYRNATEFYRSRAPATIAAIPESVVAAAFES